MIHLTLPMSTRKLLNCCFAQFVSTPLNEMHSRKQYPCQMALSFWYSRTTRISSLPANMVKCCCLTSNIFLFSLFSKHEAVINAISTWLDIALITILCMPTNENKTITPRWG